MRKIACIGARRHVTRSEYPSAIAVSNAPEKKPDRPSTTPRIDLSRMRHELRTPINHILGYSEMMLEEGNLSPQFAADLQKIHASGRELQSLITQYLDDEKFFKPRDLQKLYHELRTPVNHIIGYGELLMELAEEEAKPQRVADLEKIQQAARNWLALMEGYLVETPPQDFADETSISLITGIGFHVTPPKSADSEFSDAGALLVVDDDAMNREMLARRLRRSGYTVSTAEDGVHALRLMRTQHFDLVLLDLIMPGLDGFQVLGRVKNDPTLRDIPVLLLSALDEENGIARCIEMGAEDYLSKPINPIFLRARIGASLEKKRLRDSERAAHQALLESQQKLAANLAEAADYVRKILPLPMAGEISADWRFIPSAQLGGDVLGYHWLDSKNFAMYVVDVCGHGLRAAFLSISVFNVLRSEALPQTDFRDPAAVLASLNVRFPMEKQNNMFFTIWYGVFNKATRELKFARGGHPPAALFTSEGVRELTAPGPIVGFVPEAEFVNASAQIPANSKLYLISDGAFELAKAEGGTYEVKDLLAAMEKAPSASRLDGALSWARAVHTEGTFDDDVTLLEISL
jgi:sigma-B regulation protein RsbU (phosphoserine phosphatase)